MNLFALDHRSNAFCAQGFLNLAPVFDHGDFLQVGFESPVCCSQRETAVVTKGRCLATGIALCHFLFPFLTFTTKLGKIWGIVNQPAVRDCNTNRIFFQEMLL
jgi:hypothetical protein